jgi:hypothetical protein
MNAILLKQRVDFYINLTAAARFTFAEYNLAVNDAIIEFINEQLGDEAGLNPLGFEVTQAIRDNLYTLIKTGSLTVANGTAITGRYYTVIPTSGAFPTDYYSFVSLATTVNSKTTYARPTTYNQDGPLFEDSFKVPTDKEPRYLETATGLTMYRDSTATMGAALTYIKTPATYSCGSETQVITTGGAIANGSAYYALEVSSYNSNTYQIGASFTGTGSAPTLNSGSAILTSNTTACDLPDKVHERIAKWSAEKLLASIGMASEAALIQNETNKL